MEKINIEFIDKCYKNAIKLKKDFEITEEKKWDICTVLLELGVQIGHVFDLKCNNNELKEKNRDIHNLGDEISDVLLQTIYLGYLTETDLKKKIEIKFDDIDGIVVMYGQLVEAIMEEESFRFKKERVEFKNRREFIKDRILKIYLITLNYAEKNNINVIKEFNDMIQDARGFLNKYEKEHKV